MLPELLGVDEKKISYLYLHRYYQRVFAAKLKRGIDDIANPAEGEQGGGLQNKLRKSISSATKIAYIQCTNGAIIDGESKKDKIGSTTVW